jgi:lysophospholipase L1-like esterase
MKYASGFLFFAFTLTALAQDSNPAAKAAPRTDANWKKRHEMLAERTNKGNIDVLFVGDSITQGWEGNGKTVWAETLKDWKPGNIGIGGDQTQHVLWRITEGKEIEKVDPKAIVLMIGTNNFGNHSPEQVAGGIKAIVEEFRKQKPKAKILLLGVFPRAGKKPAADAKMVMADDLHPKVKATNEIIAKLDDGKMVKYLDIGKAFLDDKGNLPKSIMPDYLHLSPEGYAKWAAAIKEPVEAMVK